MRKVFCIMFFYAFAIAAYSQGNELRKFKGAIQFGYTWPSDGGGGIAFIFEPGYRINDQIATHLRYESALMVRDIGGQSTKIAATRSFTINAQYYHLTNEKFRPFAGLGLGWFLPATVGFDIIEGGIAFSYEPAGTIGLYPRLGFDYWHFTMLIDYNIIPKSEAQVAVSNGTKEIRKFKNSYMSIKLGLTFGGGRK